MSKNIDRAKLISRIADRAGESTSIQPKYWANLWGCDFLEPVPVPGLAHAATWSGTAPGTTRAPGKNHPLAGAWLVDQYCPSGGVCADPMFGIGGLWVKVSLKKVGALHGCEIESALCDLGRVNLKPLDIHLTSLSHSNAIKWRPKTKADLILFSPPFLQNHSAGSTAHQQNIRERKSLHTMQEFGSHPENLGRKKKEEFWIGLASVYENISCYIKHNGHMVVILRNRILHGRETDEVGRHINLMRSAGFKIIGVHPRDLVRPTGYQAWKFAKDPSMPWIRYEWAVVARPPT
jgi:hypothetical protein